MIVLKLTRGPATLDLNDIDNYMPGEDLKPPPAALAPAALAGSDPWRGASVDAHDPAGLREWGFGLHVQGGSEAEVKYNIALVDWFLRSGTRREPVIVVMSGNDDVPVEPLWGEYGAYLRYRIITGSAIPAEYAVGGIRNEALPDCRINLGVAPVAEAREMLAGRGAGGLVEDTKEAVDRRSRGLIIPEGTTNIVTNPSLETNTTGYLAHLTGVIARSSSYALFGIWSLQVRCIASGDGVSWALAGLSAGSTYTFSVYVSAPAGTNNVQIIYYNGATNSIAQGSGAGYGTWVRLSVTATQVGTTGALYIEGLAAGLTVYADGWQFENWGHATPYGDGGFLGWSWSGTAHASTSTRTEGYWRLPAGADVFRVDEGSMLIVWTPDRPSTDADGDLCLMSTTGATLRLFWLGGSNQWQVFFGKNVVASSTTSWPASTPIVLHLVWGAGNLKLYVNGVLTCNGSVYTPAAAPAHIYLGSDASVNVHSNGTFGGLVIYSLALVQAQVTAQYNNVLAWVAARRRLSAIPYFWNVDGDGILDNCDDSTRDNWGVIGGVPGTLPARTRWQLSPSTSLEDAYWLMSTNFGYEEFIQPTSQWYGEYQGTADPGVTSGGEYFGQVLNVARYMNAPMSKFWITEGSCHVFIRLGSSASATVTLTPFVSAGNGTGELMFGEDKAISVDTSYRWYYAGSIAFRHPDSLVERERASIAGVKLLSASAVTGKMDFIMVIDGPVLRILNSANHGWDNIRIVGTEAIAMLGNTEYDQLNVRGIAVDMHPERYNMIWTVTGDAGDAHDITNTMVVTLYVTPRYALL